MHRIVIVGGGFGGVSVARQLLKRTSRKEVEIVLIEEKSEHVYTPWLYEVATALDLVKSKAFVQRVRRRASIPFAHFPGFDGVRIIEAKVANIAPDGSFVMCVNGTTIKADAIVLAVGSLTNDFGIAGVKIFASSLKTPKEAESIALQFRRLLQDVGSGQSKKAHLVVVGAGANGVELVAEMAAVRNAFCTIHEIDAHRIHLVLCDALAAPVSMFPAQVQHRVLQRLRDLGVEFLGNTAIQEVRAGEIQAKNSMLPFDLLVWSAGVKSRREPGEVWGLPVNERGRIRIASTFLVEGKKNIFALGDAAARAGVHPDPQSAQVATAQAPTVAKNVLATFTGKKLLPFADRSWQTLLAVGGSYGIGQIFGIPFSGKKAFWLRRLVDLKYFLSVFPFIDACILWYRGGEAYGENDVTHT